MRCIAGLLMAATAAFAAAVSAPAGAEEESARPTRPIRLVLPVVAGGATDNVVRQLGACMGERLGQSLVVENRGGGAGVIGIDAVAKSAPDGYTLLFSSAPITLNTALGMQLPYDPERDFAPISLVATIPALIAVHPSTPRRSLQDLAAAARRPEGLSYAVANVGAVTHLIGEALNAKTGDHMTVVAYRGAGQAIQDVLTGRVPVIVDA